MKKIIVYILLIHSIMYGENQNSAPDNNTDTTELISTETRVTRPSQNIPTIDFSKPLVFNPNNTPAPTQPAQITNIQNLLVYVSGANENGPFGSSQNAIKQINAINNTNIGFVNVMNLVNLLYFMIAQNVQNNPYNGPTNINSNIATQNTITQNAAQQSASTQSASILSPIHANTNTQVTNSQNNAQNLPTTSSNQTFDVSKLSNQFANLIPNQIINQIANQLANTNQNTPLTQQQYLTQLISQTNALSAAGIASSGLNGNNFGGIANTNLLNQLNVIQANMNSTTQNNTQSSVGAGAKPVTPQTQHIANPNPFITLNDPVLVPKTVIWNSPLIIDDNNHFFDTQSTLALQENVIFNPGPNYTFPTDYSDYPAAIIIGKSNITIDLKGFNLSLDPRSASNFATNKPIHGISIMPGVQNIKIISSTQELHTGSISNFSGYAIYANGFSKQFEAATTGTVYNIHANLIQNVFIENILMYANLGGISMTNVLQVLINFVSVSYSTGNQEVYGINFNKVFNGVILNSKINQNYSNSDIIGIRCIDTISTIIDTTLVDNNRSLRNNATGILITSSTLQISRSNRISNCTIVGNICGYVTNKESIGIHVSGVTTDNLIQNCTIASNAYGSSLTPPVIAPETYGIKLENAALKNIISENNVAFHGSYGIIDTATLSTSLFNRNICIFNGTNYSAQVSDGTTPGGIPLPTTIVYPGNLTAYTGAGPLWQNVDVRLT